MLCTSAGHGSGSHQCLPPLTGDPFIVTPQHRSRCVLRCTAIRAMCVHLKAIPGSVQVCVPRGEGSQVASRTTRVLAHLCGQGSQDRNTSSLVFTVSWLLAVTFPASVCMCLCMRPCLSVGRNWEKHLEILAPASGDPQNSWVPEAHSPSGLTQNLVRNAQVLAHSPPTPGAPRMRHLYPKGTGLFCTGHQPLVRVGTSGAGRWVGGGGRNSQACGEC
jgi:hypothetical protein